MNDWDKYSYSPFGSTDLKRMREKARLAWLNSLRNSRGNRRRK